MTKRDGQSTKPFVSRGHQHISLWLDRAGLISQVGADNVESLGYMSAELVGMPVAELLHPDDVAYLQLWTETLRAPLVGPVRLVERSGKLTDAQCVRYPRTGPSNTIRIDLTMTEATNPQRPSTNGDPGVMA